ncbi:MAG TPA: hypothetical protein VE621_01495, partial [Bryobacteraceae bacterium]|nr:hypothetical protein [Bryobacteraceae bacterium]
MRELRGRTIALSRREPAEDIITSMLDETRSALDDVLNSGEPSDALELLVRHFRNVRDARALFETRLMQKRVALGLPLIHSGLAVNDAKENREAYERAIIDAAREAGGLSLEDG